MKYQTTIDTVSIQIDFLNENDRDIILKEILTLLNSKNIHVTHKDYPVSVHPNFSIREYQGVANKVVVASARAGSYSYRDKETNAVITIYYIALVFAGLMRYNTKLDTVANETLLTVCAYLNTHYIAFKITGLDIALDVFTDFHKLLALCTKKSPTTAYYTANDTQLFPSTTYIEKIPQHKQGEVVQKSYLYDKALKEGLKYKLTRFEVKLQSSFFAKNRLNLLADIMKALNKYHVMCVPNAKEKQRLMNEYDMSSVLRQRNIKKIGFDKHRCYHNIPAIVGFINQLFTIQKVEHK